MVDHKLHQMVGELISTKPMVMRESGGRPGWARTLWFDPFKTTVTLEKYQKIADMIQEKSRGRVFVDLSGLKFGRIEIGVNPVVISDFKPEDAEEVLVCCIGGNVKT